MKGFIELTSICGNTRLFRVNTITQVSKIIYFVESELEARPELRERKEWAWYHTRMCMRSILCARILRGSNKENGGSVMR